MAYSSSDPETPKSGPETLEPQATAQPEKTPLMDTNDPEKEKLVDESEQSQAGSEDQGQEEEDEGECGFCLYMKAGGCRDNFIAWEDCITEAEEKNEDVVEKCAQVTGKLKVCMEAHEDYYAPILRAEKAAEEQVKKEFEMEKKEEEASKGSERNLASEEKQQEEASGN